MSVTRSIANENNFIRLSSIAEGILTKDTFLTNGVPALSNTIGAPTKPADGYTSQKTCPLYMVANKAFTFYANLDTLETSANFASWSLLLVSLSPSGERSVEVDLGNTPLTKQVVSGTDYRFSVSFTTPTLKGDVFYLVIVDTSLSDQVVYVSNEIKYRANANASGLQLVRFRNPVTIFNYDYTLLASTFYNQFYIEAFTRPAGQQTNVLGYTLISGEFTAVRATTGRLIEFITQAYMLGDHEAFNAMTLHATLDFASEGAWSALRRSDSSSYGYEFGDTRDNLADGGITLEMISTFTSNRNV